MSIEIKRLIKKSEREGNTSLSSEDTSQESQAPESSKTEIKPNPQLKSKPEPKRPEARKFQSTNPTPIKRTSLQKEETPKPLNGDNPDNLGELSKAEQEHIGAEQELAEEDESRDQEKGDLEKNKQYGLRTFEALVEDHIKLTFAKEQVQKVFKNDSGTQSQINHILSEATDTNSSMNTDPGEDGKTPIRQPKIYRKLDQLANILEIITEKDENGLAPIDLINPQETQNLKIDERPDKEKLTGPFVEMIAKKVQELSTKQEDGHGLLSRGMWKVKEPKQEGDPLSEDRSVKREQIESEKAFNRDMVLETAYATNRDAYNKAKENYERVNSGAVFEEDADTSDILDWLAGVDMDVLRVFDEEDKETNLAFDISVNSAKIKDKMKRKISYALQAYVAGEYGGEGTVPYNHVTLVLDQFDSPTLYQPDSQGEDSQTAYGEAYLQAHYIQQVAEQMYPTFDQGIQTMYKLVEERNKKQNQNAERHEDDEQQVESDESIYFPSILYGSEIQAIIAAKEQMDKLEDVDKAAAIKETLIDFVDSIDQERPSTGKILDKLANQQKEYIDEQKEIIKEQGETLRSEYNEDETTTEQAHIFAQDMIRCQKTLHNIVLERIGDGNTEISEEETIDSLQSVILEKLRLTHSEESEQIRQIRQIRGNINKAIQDINSRFGGNAQPDTIESYVQNIMKNNNILPEPCGPFLGSQINNQFRNMSNTEFPDADNPYPNHATWLHTQVTEILNASID